MKLIEITLTNKQIRPTHQGPIVDLIVSNWKKKEDVTSSAGLVYSRIDNRVNNRIYAVWDKAEYKKVTAITDKLEQETFDLGQKLFRGTISKEEKVKLKELNAQLKQAKSIEANRSYVVGFLDLKRKTGWKGWAVELTWLSPEYRGKGIAKTLYEVALIKDGIILISGDIQTPDSKRLWKSFITNKKLTVWAQDLHDLDVMAQVFWDDSEDDINFGDASKGSKAFDKIWYAEKALPWERRFEDVRLIATASKGKP